MKPAPAVTALLVLPMLACVAGSDGGAPQHDSTAEVIDQPGGRETGETIEARIPPPRGYVRIPAAEGSFAAWLRDLALLPGRPPVHLHDGSLKSNQEAHFAVIEMDVGDRDLQQCADAVMRLRAEYLFGTDCRDEIGFRFTSGDLARWKDWSEGVRPHLDGNRVDWRRSASPDAGYRSFRDYLDVVFTYAGTASLSAELPAVADPARPEIGDLYIQGGFPGHAVIVVDAAENDSAERVVLLAQSYMPAQEIHVLRGHDDELGPWYRAKSRGPLITPEWSFRHTDLRRFRPTSCEAANPPAAEGAAGT